MPKKVCEDWADVLYNEKVKIQVSNDKDTELLSDILEKNNFQVMTNKGIEKSFALGNGMLVLSVQRLKTDGENYIVDEKTYPNIEFVGAKKIYPLSWNNDEITECGFITNKTEKGTKYTYISFHVLNEKGNYVIKNYKFKCLNNLLTPVEDESVIEEFDTRSNIPWFAPLGPNICNNIDEDSPFRLSIYANSIHTFMNIDNIYDSKDLEVTLGRRRTFVSEDLLTYDDGKGSPVFDPNDISVYVLPKGFNKDDFIQSDNDSLRTDTMISDLNTELNILSSKVGFGNERYKFDRGDIQTATGIISANSDMFRTIKKHELVLESSLKRLIKAIMYACNTFTNYKFTDIEQEIKIDFDDSIIEDKGAEQARASLEVGQGLRSKVDYLENIRGFSKEQAQKEYKAIQDEKLSNQQAFGFQEEWFNC